MFGVPVKSKYWCFTINNATAEERQYLQAGGNGIGYVICGDEVGENNTPHIQGYVEFKNRRTLTAIKRDIGFKRAHLEQRRGTQDEAIEYCQKDGNFWEVGEKASVRGKRKSLEDAIEAARTGSSVKDLWVCSECHLKKLRLCLDDLSNGNGSVFTGDYPVYEGDYGSDTLSTEGFELIPLAPPSRFGSFEI